MLDKLLFYSNDFEDFKKLIPRVQYLEEHGFEVAVATDAPELVRALAIGKLLVVNPETYHYTVVVTDNKTFDPRVTVEDFEVLFR